MNTPLVPGAGPLARLLPAHRAGEDARIRQAAWVARCVGRGEAAPLRPQDVTALAGALAGARCLYLGSGDFERLLATRPPVARLAR